MDRRTPLGLRKIRASENRDQRPLRRIEKTMSFGKFNSGGKREIKGGGNRKDPYFTAKGEEKKG